MATLVQLDAGDFVNPDHVQAVRQLGRDADCGLLSSPKKDRVAVYIAGMDPIVVPFDSWAEANAARERFARAIRDAAGGHAVKTEL